MARNDVIFQGRQPNLHSIESRFKREFTLVILRAKPSLTNLMSSWINTTL
jgi:hypothetical protein